MVNTVLSKLGVKEKAGFKATDKSGTSAPSKPMAAMRQLGSTITGIVRSGKMGGRRERGEEGEGGGREYLHGRISSTISGIVRSGRMGGGRRGRGEGGTICMAV